MSATRPLQPIDRHDFVVVLGAIKRQLDLLGWHIKEMRQDDEVATEIDGGLEQIDKAMDVLRRQFI